MHKCFKEKCLSFAVCDFTAENFFHSIFKRHFLNIQELVFIKVLFSESKTCCSIEIDYLTELGVSAVPALVRLAEEAD